MPLDADIYPEAYIEDAFINGLKRERNEISKYKTKHACELVEERFVQILSEQYPQQYQKAVILTKQNNPLAVLKKSYQAVVIPFENNTYPEGVYWLDKSTYEKTKNPHETLNGWKYTEVTSLDIFPVRPLSGQYRQRARELLEKTYEQVKEELTNQALNRQQYKEVVGL